MREHQSKISEFMRLANQQIPPTPTVPDEATRKLRLKIVFEEFLELVEESAFILQVKDGNGKNIGVFDDNTEFVVNEHRGPSLIGMIDAVADISVTSIGTSIACGVDICPIIEEVDNNNLLKFKIPECEAHGKMSHVREGVYVCDHPECSNTDVGGYRREDGKWAKPKNFEGPNLKKLLDEQVAKPL